MKFLKLFFVLLVITLLTACSTFLGDHNRAPQPLPKKEVYVSSSDLSGLIFFGYNSTAIDQSSQDKLKKIAQFMKAHPKQTITLTGYRDEIEIPDQWLSKKRAEAVESALEKMGIAPKRMTVIAGSFQEPLKFGCKLELKNALVCRENRRVLITFS